MRNQKNGNVPETEADKLTLAAESLTIRIISETSEDLP